MIPFSFLRWYQFTEINDLTLLSGTRGFPHWLCHLIDRDSLISHQSHQLFLYDNLRVKKETETSILVWSGFVTDSIWINKLSITSTISILNQWLVRATPFSCQSPDIQHACFPLSLCERLRIGLLNFVMLNRNLDHEHEQYQQARVHGPHTG